MNKKSPIFGNEFLLLSVCKGPQISMDSVFYRRFSGGVVLALLLLVALPSGMHSMAQRETPEHLLALAKQQTSVSGKINLLRDWLQFFPEDPKSTLVREHLIVLLKESHRPEDALQIYRGKTARHSGGGVDLGLMDCLLKTGRFGEVLRNTSLSSFHSYDFSRRVELLEYRIQAFLAQGEYGTARREVEKWLREYSADAVQCDNFEKDVQSIQLLAHNLRNLERDHGPKGNPFFISFVPDSMKRWSSKRDIPIVFFRLIPHYKDAGDIGKSALRVKYERPDVFGAMVTDMNQGFRDLSGGLFSLSFQGLNSLYLPIQPGDRDV
ncbi:MAG: hypothetical protein WC859_03070 [Elusimicrobiota bacterium]